MKTYPTYKDSGLPWLARIPAGWEALANIALFDERIERGFINDELLSVTQDRGIIKQTELEEKKDSSNEDKSAYKKVCVGDLAYNKMRMWQGAVGYSPFEGIVSPAYIVLKPKRRINTRFYHYLFRTPAYMRESYRNSYGICDDQLSLRFFNFKRMQSIIPPFDEQDAIVAFLEEKEREMQAFIANKRQMIELLNQQKTASTNRVVTRGLNPNVPLKPSGIPWLTKMPRHWNRTPVKRLLSRMDYGTSENLASDGIIRVLTMGHIQSGEIVLPERGSLNAVPSILILAKNDLLFNRTNSPELVGKVGIFRGDVADTVSFASYLVRLRVKKENDPEFVNFLLNSLAFWTYARSQALVSLHQANLNSTRYGQMLVPLPPPTEQKQITGFLKAVSAEISSAISSAEREIELMEEYRTALIAAAVTGRIDARPASSLT